MGANNSMLKQETVTTQCTEILNKSINNFVQERSINLKNEQTITFYGPNGGPVKCGKDLNIIQDAKTTMGVLLEDTSNAAANIANAATSKAQSDLSTKVDQANSGLPMLQFNNSMSIQQQTMNVKTTLATVLETNIKSSLNIDGTNKQSIIFKVPASGIDVGGDCNLSQKSAIDMIAQSTVKSAIEQLIDNKTLTETKGSMSSDVTQSNTFTLLGFIGGGIFGFIILIGIIYMIFKKKSDGASPGK